ncbi:MULTISPECIES: hypothetical protein [unclassified Pseudoalteromonas]|uniref:hypothetical protein n=1 Tax=unclassified Pseudoalteromonas TaxID=194690 RepID=UPI000F756DAA|nr:MULTISPECIES: hypothetical protein [unclassified Pseudoalteromonas]AZN32688.1 hypothetical protein EJ103_08090 [Pseudoalteromonas sp. Xi13]TMP15463.1 hypothetical protein CWC04_14155 [Pseudoalteromonas sp. S2893]
MRKFDPKTISDDLLKRAGLKYLSPIAIERQEYSKELNCLKNTTKYIENHGDELQFGWLITVIGNVAIQLTAHALVKKSDNSFLCVTLNENRKNTAKFSPDNSIDQLIQNEYLPSRFIPLVDDEVLDNYLDLHKRHDELRLMGFDNSCSEIQDINGSCQALYPQIQALAVKNTGRNDYCYCGSSKKHKKCCG